MKIFITGAAGFIGFHAACVLLESGWQVHGYDSLNNYYDPFYKHLRLAKLQRHPNFSFSQGLLEDNVSLIKSYKNFSPTHLLHLAAQAGVRYSLENPLAYIHSNILGFQNIIELARDSNLTNFVYASSSSVYGGNKIYPFSEDQNISNPISLYATTKIANELVARTYGNLFGLISTGLRFFTVYGPMGRPDMALFTFTEKILKGETISLYNYGNMVRDFTFVDDIVQGIIAAINKPQLNQIYNLARGKQENLLRMIEVLERALGREAKKNLMSIQAGDVEKTTADISKAVRDLNYSPKTSIDEGIPRFVDWYLSEHNRKSI